MACGAELHELVMICRLYYDLLVYKDLKHIGLFFNASGTFSMMVVLWNI